MPTRLAPRLIDAYRLRYSSVLYPKPSLPRTCLVPKHGDIRRPGRKSIKLRIETVWNLLRTSTVLSSVGVVFHSYKTITKN